MTSDVTAEGLGPADREASRDPTPAAATLLDACDRVLDERGRRRHVFSWLRPPDAETDGWLAVDAYYPSNRLVVVIGAQHAPHGDLYRELVPARGLRLLELEAEDFDSPEPATLVAVLQRLIADLGPAPERARDAPLPQKRSGPSLAETTVARVAAAFAHEAPSAAPEPRRVGPSQAAAAERAARFVAARKGEAPRRVQRPAPERAPRAAPAQRPFPSAEPRPRPPVGRAGASPSEIEPLGVVMGLVVFAVVLAELYLGVGRIALDGGLLLLGFGLALDACARALGAVAASRTGRDDWSWRCAFGGSPVVAAFTLFGPDGPVREDPAPLAGLIALLAIVLVAVALLTAPLGI